jgi:hypothetical protein
MCKALWVNRMAWVQDLEGCEEAEAGGEDCQVVVVHVESHEVGEAVEVAWEVCNVVVADPALLEPGEIQCLKRELEHRKGREYGIRQGLKGREYGIRQGLKGREYGIRQGLESMGSGRVSRVWDQAGSREYGIRQGLEGNLEQKKGVKGQGVLIERMDHDSSLVVEIGERGHLWK